MTSVERIFTYIEIEPESDNSDDDALRLHPGASASIAAHPGTGVFITSTRGTTRKSSTSVFDRSLANEQLSSCHIYPALGEKIHPQGVTGAGGAWPSRGVIQARDVSMAYGPDTPLAINHIEFTIQSQEKVSCSIHRSILCFLVIFDHHIKNNVLLMFGCKLG